MSKPISQKKIFELAKDYNMTCLPNIIFDSFYKKEITSDDFICYVIIQYLSQKKGENKISEEELQKFLSD